MGPDEAAAARPLTAYFLIAFAISWGGILAVCLPTGIPGRGAALDALFVPVFVFMLAGPFFASLGLTYGFGGWAGVGRLFRGFTVWRLKPREWLLATCLIPASALIVLVPLSLVSPAFVPGFLDDGGGLAMVGLSFAGGLMVALIEETGWTGFATPRLIARYGVMTAAIGLGVIHGGWHFMSNIWFAGEAYGAMFWPFFLTAWILAVVNLRILAVRLYAKTRSVLVGAVVHASHTGGLLAIWPVASSPAQDVLWTAGFAAVGALALWGAIRAGWL